MSHIKKKQKESGDPEEEHLNIDFDRIFLIGRTELGFSQQEVEQMTFGKWSDIFHAYRELNNFKAKGGLYPDIEEEIEQHQREKQPVASLLSL